MSRIQQKIYCPKEDKIVDRSELVRGYEIEKDRYVTFTDEELKKLEAQADRAVEITEFIPASEVDPVYSKIPICSDASRLPPRPTICYRKR